MNPKTHMVAMAGFARGTMMVMKMRKLEHPSMRAAFSRSTGMVLKNWRIRNTLNTPPPKKKGTIRGSHVLTHPILLNRINMGMRVIWAGSMMVHSKTTKRKSRNGQRSRAKL